MTSPAETAYEDAAEHGDGVRKLVTENLSLVNQVVERSFGLVSDFVPREDLISAGTLGLVEAAHRFDPSRGAKFRTFAYYRVKGAIVDFLRQNDWLGKSAREQLSALQQAVREFRGREGRKPTIGELALRLEMSEEEILRVLSYEKWDNVRSVESRATGPDGKMSALGALIPSNEKPPDEKAEWNERVERVGEAIRQLPERQQQIIVMYYYEDLYMAEMAEVFGVSEGRISQIHTEAIYNLTRLLEEG